MTSISEIVNRHVNYRMAEATEEMKIRQSVENSLHFVAVRMFSAEAIGAAAAKLDGDRAVALQVIAAAFGALDSDRFKEQSSDRSCERCDAFIGFTISGFSLFSQLAVCPNCGVMEITYTEPRRGTEDPD